MHISDVTVEKLLKSFKNITDEQSEALKTESEASHHSLQDVAIEQGLVTERDLIKLFSEYTKIPYVEIDPRDIDPEVLHKIPERIARQYNAVLFKIDEDGTHHLAMEDPDDVLAVNFLEKELGVPIRIVSLGPDRAQTIIRK